MLVTSSVVLGHATRGTSLPRLSLSPPFCVFVSISVSLAHALKGKRPEG